MKQILSVILMCLMLSFGIMAFAAGTEPAVSVVCDATVDSEAEFDVYVAVTENSNICGGNMVISYDKDVLELVSAEADELLAWATFQANEEYTDSSAEIGWINDSNITDGGNLVKLTFKAKTVYSAVDTLISIESIKVTDEDTVEIFPDCTDGAVTINAKSAPVFSASVEGKATQGENINVSINISENTFAAGGRFDVVYDNTKLTVADVKAGNGLSEASVQINPALAKNKIRVNWSSKTTMPEYYSGELIVITFTVLDGTSGTAELSFGSSRIMDASNKGVLCETVGKSIEIAQKITVTLDGTVTETDGTIVLGKDNGDNTYSLPDNVVGYYMTQGDELKLLDAGKYTVTGGEVITTVDFNVRIISGAQVRYGGRLDEAGKISAGNGLRFLAQVDRSAFDGVSYGMKITAEGSNNETIVEAEKWQDDTTFSVAITDMAISNYNRNFTATPYVKVKYTDGTEKTVYGKDSVTRSIYYVAAGLLKTGGADEQLISTSYGLYDVLNAYVNMVGVRMSLYADGSVSARVDGKGAYSGEVFFDVYSVDNEDGSYTITVTPITEGFSYPVKIMSYWDEFVRINNNNSVVKANISDVVYNTDGGVTFKFTVPNN